jgi:hypothetical protein
MSSSVLESAPSRRNGVEVDLDGLLCALVLAPATFSRNRFFGVFETPAASRVRRRAARVRGVVRQLLGQGRPKAELVGERVLDDGQVFLRYRIEELAFERTVALSRLEAATLRYALHQAGAGELADEDRDHVVEALQRLGRDLPV